MIPPLVLDVEPHHKVRLCGQFFLIMCDKFRVQVLDMCAAPGSKVRNSRGAWERNETLKARLFPISRLRSFLTPCTRVLQEPIQQAS